MEKKCPVKPCIRACYRWNLFHVHRYQHIFMIISNNLFLFVCLMVFNATFNNISVISWWSVLLVHETGVPGEKQVTDKLYHIMLYTSPWAWFELTTSVVIGTDCIGSCKSNYHKIMTTTAPQTICVLLLTYMRLV